MRNKTWRNVAVMMTVVAGVSMAPVAEAKCGSCGAKTAEATTKKAAEAPDISLADLKQAIADKDVVLIDCNSTKSYASGHIPGAIDLQSAGDGLAGMLPKDKATLIVAYCGGPKCMAYKAGVEAATKLGYTNVKHFSGGLSGWKKADEKLETAALCPKCGTVKGSPECCKASKSQ